MRGTTKSSGAAVFPRVISTHVPHAGHDKVERRRCGYCQNFNSRAPCGARPYVAFDRFQLWKFQLTCPVRGTTIPEINFFISFPISTHVPRAGHDCNVPRALHLLANFNSRAPCGARRFYKIFAAVGSSFQLTCPMRGTTRSSSHSHSFWEFQLTCPMRGTTDEQERFINWAEISTHVPHAGHDYFGRGRIVDIPNFNSRAPCGARRAGLRRTSPSSAFQLTCPMRGTTGLDGDCAATICKFQLTCPMRGTTQRPPPRVRWRPISTHVPHAGHDLISLASVSTLNDFNSRAPCGARPLRR